MCSQFMMHGQTNIKLKINLLLSGDTYLQSAAVRERDFLKTCRRYSNVKQDKQRQIADIQPVRCAQQSVAGTHTGAYRQINNDISFFLLARSPSGGPWPPPHSRGFLWFRDHTQRHTTVGRTPLDE